MALLLFLSFDPPHLIANTRDPANKSLWRLGFNFFWLFCALHYAINIQQQVISDSRVGNLPKTDVRLKASR
jgi:hypothetical protein